MALTNTDLFNTVGIVLLFNAGFIMLILGYITERFLTKIVMHETAGILLVTLGVIFATTATDYYPIGWAFLIIGVIGLFSGLIEGVAALYRVFTTEDFEREGEFD